MSRMAPTSTGTAAPPTLSELQRFVLERGLDVGFAYDGDADRCIAVDANGTDGRTATLILYICGKRLKDEGQLSNDTDCDDE